MIYTTLVPSFRRQLVGLLGRGISSSEVRYLHTEQQQKTPGLSPLANYTAERPPLVGEVSANFSG
jgi:hypothetical protein